MLVEPGTESPSVYPKAHCWTNSMSRMMAPAKTDAIDARRMLQLFQLQDHVPMAKAILREVAPVAETETRLKALTRRRKQRVDDRLCLAPHAGRLARDLSGPAGGYGPSGRPVVSQLTGFARRSDQTQKRSAIYFAGERCYWQGLCGQDSTMATGSNVLGFCCLPGNHDRV